MFLIVLKLLFPNFPIIFQNISFPKYIIYYQIKKRRQWHFFRHFSEILKLKLSDTFDQKLKFWKIWKILNITISYAKNIIFFSPKFLLCFDNKHSWQKIREFFLAKISNPQKKLRTTKIILFADLSQNVQFFSFCEIWIIHILIIF